MLELAKSSREAMKSKARRLCGESGQKVDSSNWSPAKPLNAEKKTGLQPIGKKCGGSISGSAPAFRADRKPRKAGGRVENDKTEAKDTADAIVNRDVKAANAKVAGKPHEGGMKCGGRAKKNAGGVMEVLSPAYGLVRALQRGGKDQERDAAEQAKGMAMANAMRKSGGKVNKAKDGDKDDRQARATGGRTKGKGKTNISINILAGQKPAEAPAMPIGGAPPAPVPMPAVTTPPPAQSQMPIMAPPPGGVVPPAQQRPIALKRGGRAYSSYKDMDAGAGTGDGRLEKTEIQGKKRRA